MALEYFLWIVLPYFMYIKPIKIKNGVLSKYSKANFPLIPNKIEIDTIEYDKFFMVANNFLDKHYFVVFISDPRRLRISPDVFS